MLVEWKQDRRKCFNVLRRTQVTGIPPYHFPLGEKACLKMRRDKDNKGDSKGDDKEDSGGDDKGGEGSRTLIEFVSWSSLYYRCPLQVY